MIKTLKNNLVYTNRFFDIFDDNVLFNGKTEGTYLKLKPKNVNPKAGGIMVLPITTEGKIVLQQEYRYGYGNWMYSVVAGFTSDQLSLEESVLRELREEIQHETKIENIKILGKTVNMPNIIGDNLFLYYAEKCSLNENYKPELEESFRNRLYLTLDEAFNMVMENKIICSASQFMILKYYILKNKK